MTNESAENKGFSGWAVVEQFGHQKIVGFVTTEQYGQACMFRVDVPDLPEREVEMQRPGYAILADETQQWVPAGTKVKTQAEPGRSKLLGIGAIYAITPVSEEVARGIIDGDRKLPLIVLGLPSAVKALPPVSEFDSNLPPLDEDYENETAGGYAL